MHEVLLPRLLKKGEGKATLSEARIAALQLSENVAKGAMATATESLAKSSIVADSTITVPNSGDDHHGIPTAIFFSDIPTAVERNTAPALIEKLSALSQKYRYFEEKLVKSRDSLEEKIAEVQRALNAVKALAEKSTRSGENSRNIDTQFELSDGIYVKASVPPTDRVCLWLGANIMVEYNHAEAIELLTNNLESARNNFEETCGDISYLRDQLNTTDVNLSRVYNHHVQSIRSTQTSQKSGTSNIAASQQE